MHEVEKRIADWRKGMPRTLSEETIDELESHLRDGVTDLMTRGLGPEEAFERAARDLGSMSGLAREFEKTDRGLWLPIKFAIAVGLLGVAAGVGTLLLNLDSTGMKFLLASHVVLVTLGYSMTFLIGALGICYVGQRALWGFPRQQLRVLGRATLAFGSVGVIATTGAVVLGAVWANAAWGRFWGWDPKEVGGLAVIAWQLTFLGAQWIVGRSKMNEQVVVVMSILGNAVVGLAWFGTNLLTGTRGYETSAWIILVMALAVNCGLFIAGFAPAGWLRRWKTL